MNAKWATIVLLTLLTLTHVVNAQQPQYVPVSIDSISNWSLEWVNVSTGIISLGGIPFALNGRIFAMQGRGSESRPTQATISDLSIANPNAIYILPSGGWLYESIRGGKIGEVTPCFSDGSCWTYDLIAGRDVRETWDSTEPGILKSVNNPNWQNVYSGSSRYNSSRQAYLDMLRIDMPAEYRTKTITSIVFRDTSRGLGANPDPAWHLAGVTVETISLPTGYVARLLDGYAIDLIFDPQTCVLVNGHDLVVTELQRELELLNRISDNNSLYSELFSYLRPRDGGAELLRHRVEELMFSINPECTPNRFHFVVGDSVRGIKIMDSSGLGNIAYGYFITLVGFPQWTQDLIADIAQKFNETTLAEIAMGCNFNTDCISLAITIVGDNPDDRRQRLVGERMARAGQPFSADFFIRYANTYDLF